MFIPTLSFPHCGIGPHVLYEVDLLTPQGAPDAVGPVRYHYYTTKHIIATELN